jgi:Family of unknown function (DUF6529)
MGLAGAAVAGALYAAGRLHTPNYTFSLFGKTGLAAITLKALLVSALLGLAAVQVLLALWLYRKLPLAGRFHWPYGASGAKLSRVRALP